MKRILACFFSVAIPAVGQAGAYGFGGTCAGSGEFTRTALEHTEQIRSALEALKNNDKCKGIYDLAQPLIQQSAQSLQQQPDGDNESFKRMLALPGEIAALRRYSAADGPMKQAVLSLLTQKGFDAAHLAAEDVMKSGPVLPAGAAVSPDARLQAMANGVGAVAQRSMRAMDTGITALSGLMAAIGSSPECIESSGGAGTALFAAAVQSMAVFASNDNGLGFRLAGAINSMGEMLRRQEIGNALRGLNKNEFWNSAACLLESTTDNYCKTLDERSLLETELNEMANREKKIQTDSNHPLSGLFVMMRDVPIVTSWLRDLRTGIVPQYDADSQRMQAVNNTVNNTLNTANALQGSINQTSAIIKDLGDKQAQRYRTVDLLGIIMARLGGGGGGPAGFPGLAGGGGGEENFFGTSISPDFLPFHLIGMSSIPDKCQPSLGLARQSWDSWMKQEAAAAPYFDNIDVTLRTITRNVEVIVANATNRASTYFIRQMSVDPRHLVTKATIGVVPVAQSLKNIQAYLVNLNSVLGRNPEHALTVNLIRSTHGRIARVLRSIKLLSETAAAKRLTNFDNATLAEDRDTERQFRDVIKDAFENFNMLQQFDSFFQRRISTLVMDDLVRKTAPGSQLSKYERDLMAHSGDDLLNRMLRVLSKDPTAVRQDIDRALVTGKSNIAAMEQYFGPRLYPMFDELSLVASGRQMTREEMIDAINEASSRRASRDYFVTNAENSFDGALKMLNPIRHATFRFPWWGYRAQHPELYPMYEKSGASLIPNFGTRITSFQPFRENQFSSFGQVLARICVQTLAFDTPHKYWQYCGGKVLESALETYRKEADPSALSLNTAYDDYIHLNQPPAEWGRRPPVTSDRQRYDFAMSQRQRIMRDEQRTSLSEGYIRDRAICGLHRFKLRNAVYSMTQASMAQARRTKQISVYSINQVNPGANSIASQILRDAPRRALPGNDAPPAGSAPAGAAPAIPADPGLDAPGAPPPFLPDVPPALPLAPGAGNAPAGSSPFPGMAPTGPRLGSVPGSPTAVLPGAPRLSPTLPGMSNNRGSGIPALPGVATLPPGLAGSGLRPGGAPPPHGGPSGAPTGPSDDLPAGPLNGMPSGEFGAFGVPSAPSPAAPAALAAVATEVPVSIPSHVGLYVLDEKRVKGGSVPASRAHATYAFVTHTGEIVTIWTGEGDDLDPSWMGYSWNDQSEGYVFENGRIGLRNAPEYNYGKKLTNGEVEQLPQYLGDIHEAVLLMATLDAKLKRQGLSAAYVYDERVYRMGEEAANFANNGRLELLRALNHDSAIAANYLKEGGFTGIVFPLERRHNRGSSTLSADRYPIVSTRAGLPRASLLQIFPTTPEDGIPVDLLMTGMRERRLRVDFLSP